MESLSRWILNVDEFPPPVLPGQQEPWGTPALPWPRPTLCFQPQPDQQNWQWRKLRKIFRRCIISILPSQSTAYFQLWVSLFDLTAHPQYGYRIFQHPAGITNAWGWHGMVRRYVSFNVRQTGCFFTSSVRSMTSWATTGRDCWVGGSTAARGSSEQD